MPRGAHRRERSITSGLAAVTATLVLATGLVLASAGSASAIDFGPPWATEPPDCPEAERGSSIEHADWIPAESEPCMQKADDVVSVTAGPATKVGTGDAPSFSIPLSFAWNMELCPEYPDYFDKTCSFHGGRVGIGDTLLKHVGIFPFPQGSWCPQLFECYRNGIAGLTQDTRYQVRPSAEVNGADGCFHCDSHVVTIDPIPRSWFPEEARFTTPEVLPPGWYALTLTTTYHGEEHGASGGFNEVAINVPFQVGGVHNAPPTATCTGTRSGDPGNYHFVASASDPDSGNVLSYEWDYGDGSPKEGGASRVHEYTKPGTFNASVTVTDPQGETAVTQCPVAVPAPELSVVVSLVDHEGRSLSPDEEVTARLSVSTGEGVGPLSDLAFAEPALKMEPNDGTLTITSPPNPSIPSTFGLDPNDSVDFDFGLKATGSGRVRLSSKVVGKDAANRPVEETSGPLTLNVQVLKVELTATPDPIDLDENDDGPVPKDVTLTAKITNTTEDPIDNVTVTPDLLITPLGQTPTARLPIVETSGPSPTGELGTIGPGEANARQVTFLLKAVDDGKVRIQAFVEAPDPDGGTTPLRSAGQKEMTIDPDIALYLETELIGAGGGRERNVNSGDPVLVRGYIENRLNEQSIKLDPLLPITDGPIGNGKPMPLHLLLASGPQREGCTIPLEGTLEPGQKVEFQALVQTWIDDGTRGTIDYKPKGKVMGDDGEETPLKPEQILVKSGTLPFTLHLDDGNEQPATNSDILTVLTRFTSGFFKAVPQWLSSGFAGLKAIIEEGPLILGKLTADGLISMVQAADYLGDYVMGVLEDPGALDELTNQVAADIAEATGKSLEEVLPEAQAAIQGWFQPYQNALQSGDYATAFDLLGQVSGNIVLEVATCYAKLPGAASFVQLAEKVKQTGLAKRLSEGLKALNAGDILGPDDVQNIFTIGLKHSQAFAALAKQKGLLITARFRQTKSLEWIRDFFAILKPERIKIKNVDEIDHLFLGYRPDKEASVILKRPLDLSDVRAEELYALKTSNPDAYQAALDTELSRFSSGYSGATAELQDAARSRLDTRIKEWVSPDEGYRKDLVGLAEAGRIPLPWNYRDNFTSSSRGGLPNTYTERSFALEAIEGETDQWVVQMGDKGGILRPVTGDIDIVGIQKANGRALSPKERVEIYKILQETTGMQHPETATWIGPNGEVLFTTKANLLADHAPGGEALVQFAPDGQARAVFISPELSYLNAATGDAHLWYVGGYRQPKPLVFNFGENNLLGVYFTDRPIPRFVPYTVPGHWVLDGVEDGNWDDGGMGGCSVSFGDGPNAGIIRQDGQGGLQQYTPSDPIGTWQVYDTSGCHGSGGGGPAPRMRAFAESGDLHIELKPQTALTSATASGDRKIDVVDLHESDPALFTGPESEFRVGDTVVINPGAGNEEMAKIASFGSIIFENALKNPHEAGEMIAVVSSSGAGGGGVPVGAGGGGGSSGDGTGGGGDAASGKGGGASGATTSCTTVDVSGLAGSRVSIAGVGWAPQGSIGLAFDKKRRKPIVADGAGTFVVSRKVPRGASPGRHRIHCRGTAASGTLVHDSAGFKVERIGQTSMRLPVESDQKPLATAVALAALVPPLLLLRRRRSNAIR